jgi:hypothetical protein
MGIEKTQAPKFTFLKAELNLAIDQIKVEPGAVLVIRPKYRFSNFSADYCSWLSDNIMSVVPPGTKVMILAEDSTHIEVLEPDPPRDVEAYGADKGEAYEKGWRDAFLALERACS